MTFEIYVANLSAYVSGSLTGMWLPLPADPETLKSSLVKIGVGPNGEYFTPDCNSDIDGLSTVIGEYTSLERLNELAEALTALDKWDLKKVEAIIEWESLSIESLMETLEDLSDYDFLPDVRTDEDLGRYFAEELCAIEIPDYLCNYFDYDAYGRDIRLESSGGFITGGFLLAP